MREAKSRKQEHLFLILYIYSLNKMISLILLSYKINNIISMHHNVNILTRSVNDACVSDVILNKKGGGGSLSAPELFVHKFKQKEKA